MKQILCLGLAALSATAAAQAPATLTTAKETEPFAQCFARSQDAASRPWSFVPKESGGGTFSNAGASGVRHPYFVEIADRGGQRRIRVTAGADPSLVRTVDGCI
jgi:hypothetical protein